MALNRSIMIIGNGDVTSAAKALVAQADLVIRFNDCRSAASGPVRTDVVAVCNTGRPAVAMLSGTGWKSNPAVGAASSIWCVRDGQKFADMRPAILASHPELDDFCEDHTAGFQAFAEESGKQLHIISPRVHEEVDRDLALFQPGDYVVPSSGMVVIAEVLANHAQPGDDVVISGFGHVGWELHPFQAERRLVEDLIGRGKLRRV